MSAAFVIAQSDADIPDVSRVSYTHVGGFVHCEVNVFNRDQFLGA